MAFPTVPLPDVWDIPSMPGVPDLLGPSIGDAPSSFGGSSVPDTAAQISAAFKLWGIFSGENPVLTTGRVVELGHEAQYQVSTAPSEQGNFVSYNKSKIPGLTTVVMICDGSESGLISGADPVQVRKSFFTTLEQVVADTKLYDVHMPEKSFTNANIVGYRFRRSEVDGLTMPIVEVQLQEIRSSATLSILDTKSKTPAASSPVESGQVQIQSLPSGAPDLSGITRGVTKSWLVSSL